LRSGRCAGAGAVMARSGAIECLAPIHAVLPESPCGDELRARDGVIRGAAIESGVHAVPQPRNPVCFRNPRARGRRFAPVHSNLGSLKGLELRFRISCFCDCRRALYLGLNQDNDRADAITKRASAFAGMDSVEEPFLRSGQSPERVVLQTRRSMTEPRQDQETSRLGLR
jgi:hypothetical protein